MDSVKDLLSNFGRKQSFVDRMIHGRDPGLVKRVGVGGADLAKRVGEGGSDLARRVSSSSVDLAKKVGARNALIGAAVLGGLIVGGVYLSRYFRDREEMEGEEGDDVSVDGRRSRRLSARKRARAVNAHMANAH